MFSKSTAFTVSAFAAAVAAHGTVTGIVADDVYYRGFRLEDYYTKANGGALPSVPGWYAENLDNGFIAPSAYATSDINCHKNAAPGAATATVAAGGKVDFQWTAWPESHVGPILTYVAKCTGDCSSADKTTLEWVKIDEAAYNYDQSKWEVLNMIANNNTWSVTVPSTLAAGNYVFRHEIIALHSAGSEDGAQNYPQCLNIAVTGSGTESPAGTLGTELYKSTDAGILVNIYTTITDYVIPGPALFGSGSSSGSGSGAASSAPAASSPAATSAPVASSSPAAVSSAAQITSSPSSTPAASTPVAAAASSSPSSSSPAAATSAPVPTVTAAPVPTQAISAIGQLTTAIPSELLTGALPTAVPTAGTPGSSGDLPSTPLPEGMTLKDLLDWIQYILKNYFKNGGHGRGRKHARAF